MRFKRCVIIIAILTIMNCLVSCGYVMLESTDAKDFQSTFLKAREYCSSMVWKEEYNQENDEIILVPDYPEMLPKLVDYSEISLFCTKCVKDLPVGNTVQILVSVKYDKTTDYDSEKQRISSIKLENPVLIRDDLFDDSVIISTVSLKNICEYVICSDDNLTLTYVYLESVNKEDVLFDIKYLPKGYLDYSSISGLSYSIYREVLQGQQ